MDKIFYIDSTKDFDFNDLVIQKAVEILKAEMIIAIPTDTVYGIAAFAQSTTAVKNIYRIKQRHHQKAIAICVSNIDEVKRWGEVTVTDNMLNELLPGPVTLIFKKSPLLNPDLNPLSDTIGIRIPEHTFIQALAKACGQPLALTSANLSSYRSSLKVEEFEELWPLLDLIVDAGSLGHTEESRSGSTVVDLTVNGRYSIVRDGCALNYVTGIMEQKYGLTRL